MAVFSPPKIIETVAPPALSPYTWLLIPNGTETKEPIRKYLSPDPYMSESMSSPSLGPIFRVGSPGKANLVPLLISIPKLELSPAKPCKLLYASRALLGSQFQIVFPHVKALKLVIFKFLYPIKSLPKA